MKKIFALVTLAVALFSSCSDTEYELHETYFTPQEPYGKVLYADQVSDSTRVVSYDPWTASAMFNNGQEAWFSITPTSCNFIAGEQFASTRIDIQASVNNTGKNRNGHIVLKSYDTLGMLIKQTTWLNIIYPFGKTATMDNEGNEIPEEDRIMTFAASTIATQNQFEIEFTVYADGATLQADADWLKPQATTFAAGNHKAIILAEENPNTVARTANLILTSNGISTPITITQAQANDK